ncbi:MAG TPA: SIMPL domain-containing protein [Candidatus Limnocylindrales bacterium]|nr:SIMPL domain-containing protein [Candidatus Limnocylindrales bacterium]
MSQSTRTAAAAAAGALVVAIAALSVHAGPSAAAVVSSNDPAPHTITVSASGKVTIVPDVARVTLGVTFTRPTVKAARADAASAMTNIIDSVKKLGIADADIQTVGINLYPQYSNTPGRVTGYSISEQLLITIRDLDKAGDVVDAATAQGATDVNGISFELADPAKAMNDARAAAVTAAQASAQAMASAGHVSLGQIVSISDTNAVVPIPFGVRSAAGAADSSVPTPVQVGTQDVSITLTVVFAIG